jgi:hypothetical protein
MDVNKGVGTASELKTKYGVGYTLHLMWDAALHSLEAEISVEICVRSVFPSTSDAQIASTPMNMLIHFPLEATNLFETLFKVLEQENLAQRWGILGMVLSLKSLDQVFFRICQGDCPGDENSAALTERGEPPTLPQGSDSGEILASFAVQGHRSLKNNMDRYRQLRCIFRLRFMCAVREYSTILLFFLPAFMIGISELFSSSMAGHDEAMNEEHIRGQKRRLTTFSAFNSSIENGEEEEGSSSFEWVRGENAQRRLSFMTYLAVSLCYSAGLYASRVVKDREAGHRSFLRIMTCSAPAYWLGNLCADWMLHCMSVLVTLAVVFLVASGDVAWFLVSSRSLVLLASFGVDIISISYLFSLVFEKAETSLRWVPLILMMTPLLSIPILILLLVFNVATAWLTVRVFIAISPLLTFLVAFISLLFDGQR